MASVKELAYLGVEASDLAAWDFFMIDILGIPAAEMLEDGTRVFRLDERARRITVHPGPADDVTYVGWEAANDADLDALTGQLRASGIAVTEATPETTKARLVDRLVQFNDPDGVPSEICVGPASSGAPFCSDLLAGKFVTGEMGLGHIATESRHYQTTYDFYTRMLGFRLTDYVQPGFIAEPGMAFMHCNPRHHSIVFAEFPGYAPGNIHHLLIEVERAEDVVRAYDRVKANDVPLMLEIGRHSNDTTFSFYAITPSGFGVEFGWGSRTVHDELQDWDVKTWGLEGGWGHQLAIPMPGSDS